MILLTVFQGNLGLAIIVLTLAIRVLLWNTTKQQAAMQQGMGDMQGKLKELEEKYKDDKETLAKESMKIMKTSGMGPLKGCLGMLVQIPVFIGLLNVIRDFASGTIQSGVIYSFIIPLAWKFTDIATINHHFLGMDLFTNHNVILTALWCIFIYAQTKLTTMLQGQKLAPVAVPGAPAMPDMTKMMWPMNLVMVFMMGTFIWQAQSGVGLYLVVTTLFSVIQFALQNKEVLKVKWMTRDVELNKGWEVVSRKG
jgi:YidC/Oxa1 family membrane protein insertase